MWIGKVRAFEIEIGDVLESVYENVSPLPDTPQGTKWIVKDLIYEEYTTFVVLLRVDGQQTTIPKLSVWRWFKKDESIQSIQDTGRDS